MKTPFQIEIEYWNLLPEARLHITLHLYTEHGIIAFTTGSAFDSQWSEQPMPTGLFRSVCHIPGELLNAGGHRFDVLVVRDRSSVIYHYESTVTFEIVDREAREMSFYGREPGVVQPLLTWTTEHLGVPPEVATLAGKS